MSTRWRSEAIENRSTNHVSLRNDPDKKKTLYMSSSSNSEDIDPE
jgi:hypothetical protein